MKSTSMRTFLSSHKVLCWTALAVLFAGVAAGVFLFFVVPGSVSELHLSENAVQFTSFSQTHQLSAVTQPRQVSGKSLLWESSDEQVVSVDEKGLLTPVGNGQAVITARGQRGVGVDHCVVTVRALVSLSFETHEVLIALSRSRPLVYFSDPEEIESSLLVWSSSAPEIVSVDDTGVITALRFGEAEITVASADGTVSDVCRVIVTEDVPPEGLSFEVSEFTFRSPADVLVLRPVFVPENTAQRDLIWFSTDESVAVVDSETYAVTPLSNGTATITAKSVYGDLEASCVITVNMDIPLKGISLPHSSYTFTSFGQNYLISPVFDPVNATNKKITWTSSDPKVASVSDTGVVTSVKNGTTIISLETEDGGWKAQFTVRVEKSSTIAVTGLSLTSHSANLEKIGATAKISASVLPSDATDKRITYASANSSVAKVSSSGVVTATGYGVTQIFVRSADGNFSENFTVTVSAPPVIEIPETETPYVKGVWVASVGNLDYPSAPGLTADQLKTELNAVMDNAVRWGLNTVYFQVRPSGDALYRSKIYPSSAYVVQRQGDELPLDILEYAVSAAHERGLKLHAWVNPYRVTSATTKTDELAASNPAVLHPDWVCSDGTKLYLNPGIPAVRQLILDGVMEIVKNYDVDGVHFDDYFYPDDLSAWNDSSAYKSYGGGMSLEAWRRDNNDQLIHSVYSAVKKYDSSVEFGVSPAPVWALDSYQKGGVPIKAAYQTYSQSFADTKKWVEQGWLDYICPQVYFQINHSTAPFKPIVSWWNDLVSGTKVHLYIGIGAYRCQDVKDYQTGTEIDAELDYMESLSHVDGAVFYRYESLLSNYAGVGDAVRHRYYKDPVSTKLVFNQSSMTLDSSYTSAYVTGVSDPNYPLYADGTPVTRTEQGYFAYYVKLSGSKTTVRFTHKGQTVDYVINRVSSGGSSSSSYLSSFRFEAGSFRPAADFADRSGTQVSFSCVAPAGADVYVRIGSYIVPLTTETKKPAGGKYLKATYRGTLTLPQVDDGGNASLGYAIFYAQMGDEKVEYSPGCQIEVINKSSSYVMEVVQDRCDVRPNLDENVTPELYYIATAGTRLPVMSKADGWVKLLNGMYIAASDVTHSKSPLSSATVKSTAMSTANKYTVLSLQMTERAFHTVWLGEKAAEITLYHLSDTNLPTPALGANPLFSSVKTEKINDSTVRIVLIYHKPLHIYGYYCNFDGTTLHVNFRNPASVSSGSKPLTGVVVSLDPGHSQSSGAVGTFNGVTRTEAEWNLKLSKLVAERLRNMGATVVLTHQGEQTYSLDELIVQYRKLSPDVNVSIHFNSVPSNANPLKAYGTYTYWCYGNSHLLSDVMLDVFTEKTGLYKNRSVCDYYKVSRLCEFPSILFETAYISNPDDFTYFLSEKNMNTAADGIAEGILAFFQAQNS